MIHQPAMCFSSLRQTHSRRTLIAAIPMESKVPIASVSFRAPNWETMRISQTTALTTPNNPPVADQAIENQDAREGELFSYDKSEYLHVYEEFDETKISCFITITRDLIRHEPQSKQLRISAFPFCHMLLTVHTSHRVTFIFSQN